MAKKSDDGDKRSGTIDALGRAGPYGILGLLGLVMQAVLVAWFAQAADGPERIAAGAFMVAVLLAIVAVVAVIERGRQRASMPAAVQAAAGLDSPGVTREEIESRPKVAVDAPSAPDIVPGEIIAAPDGSYVIARPSSRWSVRQATVESTLKAKLGVQDLAGLPPISGRSILALQFGDGFIYTPRPDRTRINGRLIPLLLSEPIQRVLQITTVPRRAPPFFIESSLYDNFINLVSANVQLQLATIASISLGTLPKTNRDMLVAEQVQRFQDILMGETEVARLTLQVRITAIRGDLFDYVLAATNFRVGEGPDPAADQMDQDVVALFDSFRIASVVDPKAAAQADITQADRNYESFITTDGGQLFKGQFSIAVARLREMSFDSPEDIARAMAILRPFRTFARMLNDPGIELSDLWTAMDAAERGDSAPLRDALKSELHPPPSAEPQAIPSPAAQDLHQ